MCGEWHLVFEQLLIQKRLKNKTRNHYFVFTVILLSFVLSLCYSPLSPTLFQLSVTFDSSLSPRQFSLGLVSCFLYHAACHLRYTQSVFFLSLSLAFSFF